MIVAEEAGVVMATLTVVDERVLASPGRGRSVLAADVFVTIEGERRLSRNFVDKPSTWWRSTSSPSRSMADRGIP